MASMKAGQAGHVSDMSRGMQAGRTGTPPYKGVPMSRCPVPLSASAIPQEKPSQESPLLYRLTRARRPAAVVQALAFERFPSECPPVANDERRTVPVNSMLCVCVSRINSLGAIWALREFSGKHRTQKGSKQMGKNRGAKAALMRQMGEDGAFGPKRPPRVGRKEPVTPTLELCIEIIELFERGEMLIDICESDPRFPTELGFRMFVSRDEALSARWANAQTPSADALMAHAWRRLNREVIGPVAGMTAARWRGTGR